MKTGQARIWQWGIALLSLWALTAQAKPQVLASLNPLGLIAREIAGNCADVDRLLPVTASHHDYPMKTSDYARLQKADLILWVGPELESFLQKPLANLPANKIIGAYRLPGLSWPAQTPAVVESHGDEGHERDPHIWLNPRNALVVARALSDRLAQVDPANAGQYAANLQAFTQKMLVLDNNLQQSLKPLAGRGFAVYHEGFAHFVSHYGLHQLDYVTFTPEQKPGAKHLIQLRERLEKEGVCLFLEPYNDAQSARDLAQELHLRTGTLDAMGGQQVTSYAQLLEMMANAFSACLANR